MQTTHNPTVIQKNYLLQMEAKKLVRGHIRRYQKENNMLLWQILTIYNPQIPLVIWLRRHMPQKDIVYNSGML